MNTIRKTLLDLGLISPQALKLLSPRTRDRDPLPVYRDEDSRIIFIDNFYTGHETYESGEYRSEQSLKSDSEDERDTARRLAHFSSFYQGKAICDFGCGAGGFLRRAQASSAKAFGVELQENFIQSLARDGLEVFRDIDSMPGNLDSIFLFHSLEHLPDPVPVLESLKRKLKPDGEGKIVVEVPHAKDLLIDSLAVRPFIDFTLWSQHLILHTRESLGAFLKAAGFRNTEVYGVQRYGVAKSFNLAE